MNGATRWLALTPRDVVMVRDGRTFASWSGIEAESVSPAPSTIAGALGAAFGREPDEVRGPVLAQKSRIGWTPYFPVPADIQFVENAACRLSPRLSTATTDLSPAMPEWLVPPEGFPDLEAGGGWLPAEEMSRYLADELCPAPSGCPRSELQLEPPDLLMPERRVGLARENRVAKTGHLYQTTYLRPHEGWAFLGQCVVPEPWDAKPRPAVPFGGRGRLADVEQVTGVDWPRPPERFPGGRLLVYVATTALWPGGWRIPLPAGSRLVAAAVPGFQPVVTMTRGTRWRQARRLWWGVPAGSVYLLEFDDEDAAKQWAERAHGRAHGPAVDNRLRTAGFGVILTGVWSPS